MHNTVFFCETPFRKIIYMRPYFLKVCEPLLRACRSFIRSDTDPPPPPFVVVASGKLINNLL